MGLSHSSKQKGQVINATPQAPNQPPEPPYYGPLAQYQFVNVNVSMSHQVNFNFYQGNMVSSNVDSYYPALADQYRHGYRLLTFYHIPGQVQRAGGLFSTTVLMPFQGIFCRYPNTPPSNEQYQLYIEKSIIQPQMVWNGFLSTTSQTVTNTNHLFQTIANNAAKGGRLICIELTGQEQQQLRMGMGAHQAMPVMGCDLIFEMPLSVQPPQETYVYNVVSEPIHVSITAGFNPRPVVQCNWMGVLQANLGQGWRLVEIFMDESKSAQARGFTSNMQLNSQWYFEKPASRINDPTPVYQATYVEHQIVIQSGFSGAVTTANWEPIIQQMGNKGWELACILETPDQKVSGFGKIKMTVILFFQRKIVPDNANAMPYAQPQPAGGYPGNVGYPTGPPQQGAMPPPYSSQQTK